MPASKIDVEYFLNMRLGICEPIKVVLCSIIKGPHWINSRDIESSTADIQSNQITYFIFLFLDLVIESFISEGQVIFGITTKVVLCSVVETSLTN